MHPCLYIDLGELGLEGALRSPTAFLIRTLDEAAIRDVKMCIQENKERLNLGCLHIYVAVTNQSLNRQTSEIASVLQEWFLGDFPLVRLNLCIYMNDISSGVADINCCDEELVASLFDRCYLLSDHNEYGELNTTNRQTNIKLLAYLPLTHQPASRFDEILTAKILSEKKQLFVSAGFAQLKKPTADIYAIIHHTVQMWVAHYLETAINTPPTYVEPTNIYIKDDEKIIKDIVSVPSRPIKKSNLQSHTLHTAEQLLFDDDANRFYKDNYYCKLSYHMPDVDVSPTNLATQEQRLSTDLAALSKQIATASNRLAIKMKAPCKVGPFRQSVKKQIAEAYLGRLTLDTLQAAHNELSARHRQVVSYVNEIRELIAKLKAMQPPPLDSYYVEATKSILSEIDDFRYDQMTLEPTHFEHVVDIFIQQHILHHPAIALSFEDDQDIRANASLSPETYYIDILTQLYSKAPFAIFLKRHDNLICEDYLFGPKATLANLPQTDHASMYVIEDPTEITILRLIGGFFI